ncbi:MAG: acetyl-CoA C-acetyltransferase [Gammaproteobacteria bacterium]|nr:acetyl-CoA C-acetyltransferase [Pseudomonadales bacterium]
MSNSTHSAPQDSKAQPVYLVDGARTPFIKARGRPGPFTPVDLAVQCGRPLLLRQPLPRSVFDMVILGCVNVVSEEMNPARVAALRLGMGDGMPAFTVQINCGSGMQSIDTAFRYIRSGDADLILAGGAEALSHAPLLFRQQAVNWFAELAAARSASGRLRALAGFRPSYLKPVIGLERGLTDPVVAMNMGQTAEQLAHLFNISREQADAYAARSQQRLHQAQQDEVFEREIEPAFAADGKVYTYDDGVRPDSSVERLARLKPAFEPPFGRVTAGNSSQITDGACWVILASEKAVEHHGLQPIARILDSEWAALDPAVMGLGPVLSSTPILQRHALALGDIDLWEINEAFAAQVLACLRAWNDRDFCQSILKLEQAAGQLDEDILNVHGGAIGVGHPVGTSGNRIVLHLANALRLLNKKRGIATECIGGGQGGAMLLERV